MNRKQPVDPIDAYFGKLLKEARIMRGLSQSRLGELADLSFQQIQKYEWGANSLSARRLIHFAAILNVPLGWFFDGLPGDFTKEKSGDQYDDALSSDIMYRRETLELIRCFYRVKNRQKRREIYAVLKSIVNKTA